jgi:hypothetical protein
MLLQYDNTRPHTIVKTREAIIHGVHPPYIPDIAPSDFHLFGPLKDTVHGRKMESLMWSMPSELGCINRTRNDTSQAKIPLFQAGKELQNCMQSS